MALVDITWGGNYQASKFDNRYWMSYLGGATAGYEAGKLAVGLANSKDLTQVNEWKRLEESK